MEAVTESKPLPPWHEEFEKPENKAFPKYAQPMTDFQFRTVNEIKARAYWLLCILECQPESREMSIAKTKLEEAVMWAEKAVKA